AGGGDAEGERTGRGRVDRPEERAHRLRRDVLGHGGTGQRRGASSADGRRAGDAERIGLTHVAHVDAQREVLTGADLQAIERRARLEERGAFHGDGVRGRSGYLDG